MIRRAITIFAGLSAVVLVVGTMFYVAMLVVLVIGNGKLTGSGLLAGAVWFICVMSIVLALIFGDMP